MDEIQPLSGCISSTLVVNEIRKQTGWNNTRIEMFHFRTSTDREVDIVLETPNGEVVGIEVKSGAYVGSEAFKRLKALKEHSGK